MAQEVVPFKPKGNGNPAFSAIPLVLLLLVSVAGVLVRPSAPVVTGGAINPGDVAWMLTASALVLLMTPGLSFFYGGMVRTKNVVSTMLQSFVAMAVISILWVVVGFSLAFGDSIGGLIGNPATYFMFSHVGVATHPDLAPTIPLVIYAFFQLKFAIITPALITGSFAERVRFTSYLLFLCLFSVFIYCPLAHWTWHPQGFLHQWGVLDFAGGTVVHMSAGLAALAGAMVLGRRKIHLASEPHTPANLPFVLLGTGMLWFGWFGFNAGSAGAANGQATMAFATTNTASAAAALAWMFLDAWRGLKPTALGACVGAVVGLVAITPAAGYVNIGDSLFIGAVAAMVSNGVVYWKSKSALDDTLDVFPCHGVGGMVGMLMTGIFAHDVGLITGSTKTFFVHCGALIFVTAYAFLGSFVLYKITDAIIPLRVTAEQEEVGLDLSQHGEVMDEAAARAAFGLGSH
ncbi:MAG TPA: ammonium transporter [Vicinamibacterales bacterium]|jgi:Amt family ammonium transporter|nr:ammonium transporter [Vicinamibacterales bacterium]